MIYRHAAARLEDFAPRAAMWPNVRPVPASNYDRPSSVEGGYGVLPSRRVASFRKDGGLLRGTAAWRAAQGAASRLPSRRASQTRPSAESPGTAETGGASRGLSPATRLCAAGPGLFGRLRPSLGDRPGWPADGVKTMRGFTSRRSPRCTRSWTRPSWRACSRPSSWVRPRSVPAACRPGP